MGSIKKAQDKGRTRSSFRCLGASHLKAKTTHTSGGMGRRSSDSPYRVPSSLLHDEVRSLHWMMCVP